MRSPCFWELRLPFALRLVLVFARLGVAIVSSRLSFLAFFLLTIERSTRIELYDPRTGRLGERPDIDDC